MSASWVEPGLYSLRQHEREAARREWIATEDLVFKLRARLHLVTMCFL